jgi:hypothetical protein
MSRYQKPRREIRTHEPIMLRRYAVAALSSSMDSPTTDMLSVPTLLSRQTQSTTRVSGVDSSAGPWVIGRGRTHEVECPDLSTGFLVSTFPTKGQLT